MAARSHVIARTFDRVCSVLDHLGYLDGGTVTPDGRRFALTSIPSSTCWPPNACAAGCGKGWIPRSWPRACPC